MKRTKHLSSKKNHTGIIVVVVIIALVILVFALNSGNKDAKLDEVPQEQQQDESADTLAETQEPEPETIETIKEESKPVNSNKVGKEGLCEDYFFEQGDSLEILDHTILVERIGANALRLDVDGEKSVMSDDESDYLGDGIRLSIAPEKILYFGADDSSNAALIRVGCTYEDNPNEKYVVERGEKICRQIYQDCQTRFDIDLDE